MIHSMMHVFPEHMDGGAITPGDSIGQQLDLVIFILELASNMNKASPLLHGKWRGLKDFS